MAKLIIFVQIVWLLIPDITEAEESSVTSGLPIQITIIQKSLKEQGVDKKVIERLSAALTKFEQSEDASELKPFLESENELVCLSAGVLLALTEPEWTSRKVQDLLEEGRGSHFGLIPLLAFFPTKDKVDSLLELWTQASKGEDEIKRFQLSLSALTGKDFASLNEWKNWWSKNRENIKLEPATLDEALAHTRFAINAEIARSIQNIASKGGKTGEALGNIFSRLNDFNRAGIRRENSFAEKGDVQFNRGELDLAVKSYMKAIDAFPDDLKSLFLLGCIEFERGEIAEAQKRFKIVAKNDDAHVAAQYLVKLCQRRFKNPAEAILEAALHVAANLPEDQSSDILFTDIMLVHDSG